MNFFKKHKEGLLFTLLFHTGLLLLVLSLGFYTPLPLPAEKGIVIDFGNTNDGMGKEEPSESAPAPVKKITPAPSVPKPAVKVPVKAVVTPTKGEDVMTQDYEKTVAMEAAKKKTEEDKLKKIEKNKLAQLDKRRRDSIQKVELDQLEKERKIAEQIRLENELKAAEQAKATAINSKAKNAFGTGGNGTNTTGGANTGTNNSTGQGSTYKGGNNGSPDGSLNGGSSGKGEGNSGISVSLVGRSARALPKPSYPGNEEATVVVEVTVDKNGIVKEAVPGIKGSSTLNPAFLNAAKKAALSTSFNADENAPAFQKGNITYKFVLN